MIVLPAGDHVGIPAQQVLGCQGGEILFQGDALEVIFLSLDHGVGGIVCRQQREVCDVAPDVAFGLERKDGAGAGIEYTPDDVVQIGDGGDVDKGDDGAVVLAIVRQV